MKGTHWRLRDLGYGVAVVVDDDGVARDMVCAREKVVVKGKK